MKKLFFLALCMTFSLHAKAQDDDAAAPKQLDSLLVDIDKTLVTSSIIYERTTPFANLYNFNSKDTCNTADYSYFRQSMMEMYRASNAQKFISLDSLTVSLKNGLLTNNVVDVGILNTQFNIINYHEDNPDNGGLLMDSIARKFVQIPNQAPFYMMHNTVVSPLKDAVAGREIVYRFAKRFFYTNGSKEIKTLSVDFGEGTLKNIVTNGVFIDQEITIAYATNGTKTIKCTIEYSDGTTMVTQGEIYFRNTNLSPNETLSCGAVGSTDYRQDFNNQLAAIDRQGYNATDPRIKSQMDYRVFYSNGNSAKLIKKPIIIIDGFDPGDTRRIEDCDCEMDETCASKNKTGGVFDPIKHKSITDMMVYYENPDTPRDLLPVLRDLGYDVIVVNFPNYQTTNLNNGQSVDIDGGAYYIETNAMAIVKLIQDVKTQVADNGSTNQIAIIAPSMAGQISRYALSFMEKKFEETALPVWQHNVYLWVSVDSPHLGANIPLGDQALIYLLRNENDDARDFYNKRLSSPAAQQQLIEFHRPRPITPLPPNYASSNYHLVNQDMLNGQTTSQGMALDRGNPYFKIHYNNQNGNGVTGSSGWPMNLRKISVVNGSLSGSKDVNGLNGQPMIGSNGNEIRFAQDGEKVLNIRGFNVVHVDLVVGSITYTNHVASLESMFMASEGTESRIARFFKFPLDDKTTKATNINNRGVMDNVPGGYFDAQQQLMEKVTSKKPFGINRWSVRDFNPIHSFIPTFSAIAHLEPNQNWNNPLDYNLVCPSDIKTPFDSYFGGDKNTQHTSFTKESVDWLLKELDGIPQLPSYPLEVNLLAGPEAICLNSDTIYAFEDICKLPSAVAQWSVSANLEIISQSDYSITVTAIENGEATITAIFQNGITIVKTIYAGGPTLNEFTFGNSISSQNLCFVPEGNYSFSIPELNSTDEVIANFSGLTLTESLVNANWQWQTLNNVIMINGSRNTQNICTMADGQTSMSVRVRNACGWSNWYELPFEITVLPPSFEDKMYRVFPNPSSDLVNIDLADENMLPLGSDVISGELFDIMGFSKGNIVIINNKATFSVSGLNSGVYVVKIYINGVPESHQIAVP